MKKKCCQWLVFVFCFSVLQVFADCFQDEAREISLNAREVPVQTLMHAIVLPRGCSMVISDAIKGEASMKMDHVPWFEAISAIAVSYHLQITRLQHVIFFRLHKGRQVRFPMVMRLVQLKHIQAKTLLSKSKAQIKTLMSSDGKLVATGKGDGVLIYEHLDRVQSIIDTIKFCDIQVPRVRIQAKLLYIEDELLSSIGVDWGLTHGWRIALPGIDRDGGGLLHFSPQKLLLFQQSERVKVIAEPVITLMSGFESSIESGEQIPYPQKSEHGQLSVTFKKAVLKLKVLAEVMRDNRVKMDVTVNQDQVNPRMVQGVPSIQTQKLHTVITVPFNKAVVLGGVYRESKGEAYKGVPFWERYAWLSWVLGENQRSHKREQLLLILTPSMVA